MQRHGDRQAGRTLKYYAWSWLVEVRDPSSNLLATFRYDGLDRRVRETRSGTTTDLYYSPASQVLEERVGGVVQSQFVWSPGYVDALVERDRDTNADGTLDERLYAAHDANYDVTAIFDTSGNVVERYAYDPFGAGRMVKRSFHGVLCRIDLGVRGWLLILVIVVASVVMTLIECWLVQLLRPSK